MEQDSESGGDSYFSDEIICVKREQNLVTLYNFFFVDS